jgi:hypothetical protein
MNLDGSERTHLPFKTTQPGFPNYSWNEQYMFVQSFEQMMSSTPVSDIPVYDAKTLEVTSTYVGRSPYWCEPHLTFLAEGESGEPELRLADVGTANVIRLPLDGVTGSLNNLFSFPVRDERGESCWALMIMDGGQMWIVLRETGEVISIGSYASFNRIKDNALVYQAPAGANGLEIWRIRLDRPDERELLGTIQTLGQSITFFDGVERGIYLRGVRLMLVDVSSGTQTELSHRVSGQVVLSGAVICS